MGFKLSRFVKKAGKSLNKVGVKTLRAAAPVLAVTPGVGMVVGQGAMAAFNAIDTKKANKAANAAAQEAESLNLGSDASDLSVVATSQFVNAHPATQRAAGTSPQPPAADPETTGNATAFNLNALKGINPLWLAVGGLLVLLILLRRK